MMTAMRVATDRIVGGYADRMAALGGKADLQVTFGSGESGFPESIVDLVAATPGVAAASALVRGTLVDDDGRVLELFGLDLLDGDLQELYEFSIVEREPDDFTILNDPLGIFLSSATATTLSLGLGDSLGLAGATGRQVYRIRGIMEPPDLGSLYGGNVVGMFLPAAQAVTGREGSLEESLVDQVDIRVGAGITVDVVEQALAAVLPEGMMASRPMGRRLNGEQTLVGLRSTLVGMSGLGVLAAAFILYAATGSHVLRRAPEIAALISIGANRRLLVTLTLVEALVLGLVGAFIGVLLGFLLAGVVASDVAVGMSLNYSLAFGEHSGAVSYGRILLQHLLLGGLAAMVAVAVPARSLMLLSPVPNADRFGMNLPGSNLPWGERSPTARLLSFVPFSGLALALALLAVGLRLASSILVSVGGISAVFFLVLVAVPPCRVLVNAGAAFLARHSGLAGRIAQEEVRRSWSRIATTIAAMGLCIAVAVTAASLALSFRSSVDDWYGFSGDALVASRRVEGGWLNAPLDSALVGRLGSLSEVAAVATLRVAQGQPYEGSRLAVSSVSDGLLSSIFRRGLVSCDDCERAEEMVASGRGVVVSRNFAARFGKRVGDSIVLGTPTRPVSWPVVGLVADYVSDRGSVMVVDSTYRELWRDPLVNYFSITLAEGSTVADLRTSVQATLGGQLPLTVLGTDEMVARVGGMIADAFADVDAIQLLVVVITLAAIINFLISSISRRRREFALLRVAGAQLSLLRRAAALEALSLAAAASVLGLVVAGATTWIWVTYCYPVLVGYVLELNFAWSAVAVCTVLATLSAVATAVVTVSVSQRGPLANAVASD
jgi:putative ABC transport system permease protein